MTDEPSHYSWLRSREDLVLVNRSGRRRPMRDAEHTPPALWTINAELD